MFINIVGINNTLSLLLLLFHKPVSISMNHISSKFKRPHTGKKQRGKEKETERERRGATSHSFMFSTDCYIARKQSRVL